MNWIILPIDVINNRIICNYNLSTRVGWHTRRSLDSKSLFSLSRASRPIALSLSESINSFWLDICIFTSSMELLQGENKQHKKNLKLFLHGCCKWVLLDCWAIHNDVHGHLRFIFLDNFLSTHS